MMDRFTKGGSFKLLIIFAKSYFLDLLLGCKYAFAMYHKT